MFSCTCSSASDTFWSSLHYQGGNCPSFLRWAVLWGRAAPQLLPPAPAEGRWVGAETKRCMGSAGPGCEPRVRVPGHLLGLAPHGSFSCPAPGTLRAQPAPMSSSSMAIVNRCVERQEGQAWAGDWGCHLTLWCHGPRRCDVRLGPCGSFGGGQLCQVNKRLVFWLPKYD